MLQFEADAVKAYEIHSKAVRDEQEALKYKKSPDDLSGDLKSSVEDDATVRAAACQKRM